MTSEGEENQPVIAVETDEIVSEEHSSDQQSQLEMKSVTQSEDSAEDLEANVSDSPGCSEFSEFHSMMYSGSSCTNCDSLRNDNRQLRNQVKSLQGILKEKRKAVRKTQSQGK